VVDHLTQLHHHVAKLGHSTRAIWGCKQDTNAGKLADWKCSAVQHLRSLVTARERSRAVGKDTDAGKVKAQSSAALAQLGDSTGAIRGCRQDTDAGKLKAQRSAALAQLGNSAGAIQGCGQRHRRRQSESSVQCSTCAASGQHGSDLGLQTRHRRRQSESSAQCSTCAGW
jgi:hypothetical protein